MNLKKYFITATFLMMFLQLGFAKDLKIVVTYPFMADIVKNITKDKAVITSLANGYEDPHFINPRPSMIVKMRNADAVVVVGMALDVWIQGLIESSRNEKIMPGSFGYIDASRHIKKLEIPVGKVDASMGHVHLQGNPHYYLDPENIKIVVDTIADMLSKIAEEDAEYFRNNANAYNALLDTHIKKWQKILEPYSGKKIITYHTSWPYFAKFANFNVSAQIEPKPGIPPTPFHLEKLVKRISDEHIALCISEAYFSSKAPNFLNKKTGIKLLFLPVDIHSKTPQSYIDLWDENIQKIAEAMA